MALFFFSFFLVDTQVERIAKVAYDVAMKRGKRLCSVDKANVLDVSQVRRARSNKKEGLLRLLLLLLQLLRPLLLLFFAL